MEEVKLRPYQEQSREAVEKEWEEGRKRTLLVLPTGTGKTVVFSKIVEDQVKLGDRCLILAHRGELLEQASDKLLKATGLKTDKSWNPSKSCRRQRSNTSTRKAFEQI